MNYRRLRYYIRKKIRSYRKELWDYYVFREDYRSYNGHYGPLAHLHDLPMLIAEMEDILAQR